MNGMNGMGLRMVNGFKKVMMMVDGWRFFFKSGIPKSQGFNTEMVIHDLDELESPFFWALYGVQYKGE